MWFIGVELEQKTSALPPKKNPGSAPVHTFNTKINLNSSLTKPLTVKVEKSIKDSGIAAVAVHSKNKHIKPTKLYSNGSPVHVNPSPVNPALHAHA